MTSDDTKKVVDMLNDAYARDHVFVYNFIVRNTANCNKDLAENSKINVWEDVMIDGEYLTSGIGLINSVLGILELNKIGLQFSDEKDSQGRVKFIGFYCKE